ncbi:MAG TPA: hypothetical protein VMU77_02380 [Acidimicrobiales bacterium]|nr:hypothetical protein [Acidimicrobiales bacterium]
MRFDIPPYEPNGTVLSQTGEVYQLDVDALIDIHQIAPRGLAASAVRGIGARGGRERLVHVAGGAGGPSD